MELYQRFKSITDWDICPVVICDTEHRIIYMNLPQRNDTAALAAENCSGRAF